MKKSLVIISFAFIFLLTLSVVSAGLWITGDVQRSGTIASGSKIATTIYTNSNCPGVECTTGYPGSGSAGGCACPYSPTEIQSTAGTSVKTTSTRTGTTFSRTGDAKTSTQKRTSKAPECPRGWTTLLASGGGNCCRKAENPGRIGLFGRKTTATNVASGDSGAQEIKVGDTCTISMGVTGTYQTGSSGTLTCVRKASQNKGS